MKDTKLAEMAALQYGIVHSLCYTDGSTVRVDESKPVVIESSTTHAETNGMRLTKINGDWYRRADIESRFVTILHEVAHTGGWNGGRGNGNHNPDFWEEFIRLFNIVSGDVSNRQVVQSVFEQSHREQFDWKRAKYRAVQSISQVDKRSESVDERKRKVAGGIGYNLGDYAFFEQLDEWGLTQGKNGRHMELVKERVNIFSGTQRFADPFSDDELREFVEENDGYVPCPLVVLRGDELRDDGPQIIRDVDDWFVCSVGREESVKALAVQERVGHGYTGMSIELLAEKADLSEWSEAIPIPIDEMPSADFVKRQKAFDTSF